MRLTTALFLGLSFLGCSNGNGTLSDAATPPDMSASSTGDMTLYSVCGHPGDKGNSLGVGQFCNFSDPSAPSCPPTASLCSALGNSDPSNPPTYFCLKFCSGSPDAGSECGENASCVKQGAYLTCVPDVCLGGGASDGGSTGDSGSSDGGK